jgi:hypothetical protein
MSVEEALSLFLFRWCLLGERVLILEDDAQLVEAAFGRVRFINGDAKTALDEPFVLEATKNYFKMRDPLFMSAAERAMLQTNNATAHGTIWESCRLFSLKHLKLCLSRVGSYYQITPSHQILTEMSKYQDMMRTTFS